MANVTLSPLRLRAVMILVTSALFMETLDSTIITTALPQMARTFGTSSVALNTGVSAYMLALGIFIPASGWVAERFGARRVFALAIGLFALTSALCGAANNLAEFVGLRVLQGVAGAMMVPVGRLLVVHHTPREKLMDTMANIGWPALIAPVLGPPIGGFITLHAGWRWIFFLNVPIGIVALIAALAVLPSANASERRPFDLVGFALSGAGTYALLFGLDRFAERNDALGIGVFLAGLGLLGASIRHLNGTAHPLVRLTSFEIPTFRASLRGGSLSRMAIGSVPFLLPLMFQVGFGYDSFHSGLLLLAVFAGNVGMKSLTRPVLKRFGYRSVMLWNGLMASLTLALCAAFTANTPTTLIAIALVLGGMSRSMQFTAIGNIAIADVPKAQMSDANGLIIAVAQISMAAGVALGALSVRIGHWIAKEMHLDGAGIEYRIAFILVGLFALLGLRDAIRLPRDAADHFLSR